MDLGPLPLRKADLFFRLVIVITSTFSGNVRQRFPLVAATK